MGYTFNTEIVHNHNYVTIKNYINNCFLLEPGISVAKYSEKYAW